MPCAPLIMAVLMPTTSPARRHQRPAGVAGIERGVGLDDVVDQPAAEAARSERPSADTTPAVTVDSKPSGLPIATTSWPRLQPRGCRRARGRRRAGRQLGAQQRQVGVGIVAQHARLAGAAVGEGSRTRARAADHVLLVSTSPSPAMTTPEPGAAGGLPSVGRRSTRTTAGPTRSTTETTARE